MSQEWVLQKINCDDPGAMNVDWDTFNVGLLENGEFRSIYSCWDQQDANHVLSALRWYETFTKDGIIKEPVVAKKKVTRKKKATKENI